MPLYATIEIAIAGPTVLLAEKMFLEIYSRDVPARLVEDGSQRAPVQLVMHRDDQRLTFTLRAFPFQFRVTSFLTNLCETETGKDVDEVRAGKCSKPGHAPCRASVRS